MKNLTKFCRKFRNSKFSIYAFRNWLRSHKPNEFVGERLSSEDCPVARFVKRTVENELRVKVDCEVCGDIGLTFDEGPDIQLSECIVGFIRKVDKRRKPHSLSSSFAPSFIKAKTAISILDSELKKIEQNKS